MRNFKKCRAARGMSGPPPRLFRLGTNVFGVVVVFRPKGEIFLGDFKKIPGRGKSKKD